MKQKNVIPLKFLRKIKNTFFFSSWKLNPGTYCILLLFTVVLLLLTHPVYFLLS
jgi:hypothetical protein